MAGLGDTSRLHEGSSFQLEKLYVESDNQGDFKMTTKDEKNLSLLKFAFFLSLPVILILLIGHAFDNEEEAFARLFLLLLITKTRNNIVQISSS